VFAGAYHQTIFSRKNIKADDSSEPTSWKNVLIVAWTGTRGVVSLATALALPLTMQNGSPFPQRNAIMLLAFIVILVTLVVQGLTLPLLIRLLNIKPEVKIQKQEEDDLQLTLSEATLNFVDNHFPFELDEKVTEQIKKRYETTFKLLSRKKDNDRHQQKKYETQLTTLNQQLAAQLEIIKFQRELLLRYHTEGTFNDETITKAERELDIEELRLNNMITRAEE
jgi:CPA1 family monovalent cation:H+ antiporter